MGTETLIPCHWGIVILCREDGSPSWGRKPPCALYVKRFLCVEKMGPLRGDGNKRPASCLCCKIWVEKMGPLRGDGNYATSVIARFLVSREDGSPSWGRKLNNTSNNTLTSSREDGSPSWGRKPAVFLTLITKPFSVEKMGPLRGDGNTSISHP